MKWFLSLQNEKSRFWSIFKFTKQKKTFLKRFEVYKTFIYVLLYLPLYTRSVEKDTFLGCIERPKNYRECLWNSLYHYHIWDLSSCFDIHNMTTVHPKIAFSFAVLCINVKKKRQNTVFGYKKGSKMDFKIGFGSATPKLCMVIFTTFLPKWLEHRKPEGGGKPHNFPPLRFLKWQFESAFRGPCGIS